MGIWIARLNCHWQFWLVVTGRLPLVAMPPVTDYTLSALLKARVVVRSSILPTPSVTLFRRLS